MSLVNKTFYVLLLVLLASCSPRKTGDVFVDSRDNLVIRGNDGLSRFNLGDSIRGEADVFLNNGDAFVVSMSNSIIKFSLKDNAIVWKKSINSIPLANLAFNGSEKIYFTTIDNRFYILDYDTGRIEFIYSNVSERTVVHRIAPIYYRKKNLIVVTFNDGEVIIFGGRKNNILRVIYPGPARESSVTLENNLLTVNEEVIDLDKVGDK
ncbi:MAG: PQQ-like beta-propeller repeat protein [Rickettsiales bacterium]|jgi:hypothetical protein|nr:PQQ-like beta-propeller repeat protein [Rickettsiales bacterium]